MLKRIAERWFGVKNKHQAQHAKRRLSILYAFLGWNCFGLGFYVLLKNRMPEDGAKRRALYSQLTGASKNMHVYQFAGMTLTKEFEVVHERLAQKNKEAEEEEQTIVTS